jgi:hypothetical protein
MPPTAIRWSSARGHHPDVEKAVPQHWTTSAAVYLPNGEVPKPGTLFTNKQLSETYARILKEAESAGGDRVAQIEARRKAWSQGFVAEAIDKFCRTQEVMDVSARRTVACFPPTTWRAGSRPSRRRSPTTTAATPSASRASGARARSCCSSSRC